MSGQIDVCHPSYKNIFVYIQRIRGKDFTTYENNSIVREWYLKPLINASVTYIYHQGFTVIYTWFRRIHTGRAEYHVHRGGDTYKSIQSGDQYYPDNKVHGANMGPIWDRQDPWWPHELCYQGIDSRCIVVEYNTILNAAGQPDS